MIFNDLPEGASLNHNAPYNQSEDPEVTDYEVTTPAGCEYFTSYTKAVAFAKKAAAGMPSAISIEALFDNGEGFTVAELQDDSGVIVWEYGQNYDGTYAMAKGE